MNVVHINTAYSWGGGEAQTHYLVTGLLAKNIANTLIAQPNSPLALRAKEERIPLRQIHMKGEWDVFATLKLRKVLKHIQPDILHLHTAHAHTLGLVAGRLAKVGKIIATRRMDLPVSRFSARLKYNKTDKIVAISQAAKDILVRSGVRQNKIALIYSTVDSNAAPKKSDLRRHLNLPRARTLLGTVGSLLEAKGHKYLFQAMANVKNKCPNATLLVVGDGPLDDQLKKLAMELKLEKEVIFLGFRRDIPQILSILDVFVFASIKEGLGISLLEASGCGLPVIATNTGGIPEIVKDRVTGFLVPPRDSKTLAQKILYLLQNPKEARKMGENGKEFVRQTFSVEKMVESYTTLYENLIRQQ